MVEFGVGLHDPGVRDDRCGLDAVARLLEVRDRLVGNLLGDEEGPVLPIVDQLIEESHGTQTGGSVDVVGDDRPRELPAGLLDEQRRREQELVALGDDDAVVAVRPGEPRQIPEVVVEAVADVDERGRVTLRELVAQCGEVGRRTVVTDRWRHSGVPGTRRGTGVVSAVATLCVVFVAGHGVFAACGSCAASSSSSTGVSRSSLWSSTEMGSVGAPSMRFSKTTSRSRARDIPT